MPRPRIHEDNAAKQRAYRQRRKKRVAETAAPSVDAKDTESRREFVKRVTDVDDFLRGQD